VKEGFFVIFLLIVLTSLCDTINQLFLKSAINSLSLSSPITLRKVMKFIIELIMVPRVWISFLFSVLSLCIWLFVLSKADLNFAFSIDSMHYIFIAFVSRLILKEKVGIKRWSGTIFIIIGIILVSLSGF
jgi:drug/metabolite transporter (DMT)-like permease